ncbi:MAG: 30S ribosomal protein THX [Acidobacteria bacterium]|nr:30S ribosomal protein THX [Acidobacteriota bacterium]
MGKGDVRTRRGKINRGTYGVSRPKKEKEKEKKGKAATDARGRGS